MTGNRIALVVVSCLALVVAVWLGMMGTRLYWDYACGAVSYRIGDRIDSLQAQRPERISPENWEEAVGWARTAFYNLPIGAYDDPAPYRRFERALEEKMAAGDSLATLRWIWDELVENDPKGPWYAAAYMPVRAMAEEPITDESLATLWGRDRVFELWLDDTQVSDAGLRHLEDCSMLRGVVLENTQITDVGLVHLTGLPELEYLGLKGCAITDEGVATLSGIHTLEVLDLSQTQITDEALAHLQRLPRLERLTLCRTRISDAGLAHLGSFLSLTSIDLSDTNVTGAAVEEFKRAHPWRFGAGGRRVIRRRPRPASRLQSGPTSPTNASRHLPATPMRWGGW